jgi:poly(hydroxyalkanoate) depolymerase family esterase
VSEGTPVKDSLRNTMLNITRLTRSGRLLEATAAIQRALGASPVHPADPNVIDVETRFVDEAEWRETVPSAESIEAPHAEPVEAPATEPGAGGEFIAGSFSNAAGMREYKLYLPHGDFAKPLPMVVMLHGCRQNPDDFAAGTRMNELAQAQGWVVLYPGQQKAANHLGCWNWFKESEQQRGCGEPSIIAEMTRRIVATQPIDPARVYIAGMSAGGAMAAVMAATYPDLYAAVGIHSGLPHAAATSLMSALSAMKKGPAASANGLRATDQRGVPTIVFHGDRDTTVHPCNGDEVIARARWSAAAPSEPQTDGDMTVERGEVPAGHGYTRTIHRDAEGRCDAEHWLVHGSGHAWSGGSPKGSYTDPLGPDASAQMLRFFAEHPLRESS